MHDSAVRGNVSELAVAAACWRAGYIVSAPMGDSVKYDLVIDDRERLYRVQVKTGRKSGKGVLKFGCASHHNDRLQKGSVRQTKYAAHDFDYIGVYCWENGNVYLVPREDMDITQRHIFLHFSRVPGELLADKYKLRYTI